MSDQDFFFEEEERPAEDAPAKDAPKSGGSKAAAKPAGAGAAGAPITVQSVSMTVAGLAAVCALLVGVIIGLVIPRQPSIGSTTGGTGTGTGGTAPQLSPEQMEQGSLPAGHPDISGMGAGGATSAPATPAP